MTYTVTIFLGSRCLLYLLYSLYLQNSPCRMKHKTFLHLATTDWFLAEHVQILMCAEMEDNFWNNYKNYFLLHAFHLLMFWNIQTEFCPNYYKMPWQKVDVFCYRAERRHIHYLPWNTSYYETHANWSYIWISDTTLRLCSSLPVKLIQLIDVSWAVRSSKTIYEPKWKEWWRPPVFPQFPLILLQNQLAHVMKRCTHRSMHLFHPLASNETSGWAMCPVSGTAQSDQSMSACYVSSA